MAADAAGLDKSSLQSDYNRWVPQHAVSPVLWIMGLRRDGGNNQSLHYCRPSPDQCAQQSVKNFCVRRSKRGLKGLEEERREGGREGAGGGGGSSLFDKKNNGVRG
jgi:hypothetical protein